MITVLAVMGVPSAWIGITHETRRWVVVAVGGSALRAMPVNSTRPSGSSVACTGVAYQPSAVRSVVDEVHPSTTEGRVAAVAPASRAFDPDAAAPGLEGAPGTWSGSVQKNAPHSASRPSNGLATWRRSCMCLPPFPLPVVGAT